VLDRQMHQAQTWRFSVMELKQQPQHHGEKRGFRVYRTSDIFHRTTKTQKRGSFKQFCCIREGCGGNCYMLRVRNLKMYSH